ncbi:MAG: hypothetical protein H8D56_17520 [Planctomycetes bacterium]|nr:hypothetical protein [Planctomycetota bacterium]MBL7142803.1 hypothetical protein [Phycisphaerae bacterium]
MSKTTTIVTKLGQSRLDIPLERLLLDPENPRLRQETQGKNQNELLKVMHQDFNIAELADSLSQNGYFAEEPLVAVPKDLPSKLKNPTTEKLKSEFDMYVRQKTTEFYVVEGNRRLATCKLLLDSNARSSLKIKSFGIDLSVDVTESIKILPVIVYPNRDAVLTYLGVRHIVGVEKWDSYAKARYIKSMVVSGVNVDEIQAKIGDKRNATKLSYICYEILEQAKDLLNYDITKAKRNFSFLILSMGSMRNFLGMPRKINEVNLSEPVSKENLANLHFLLSCLYGDEKNEPVIDESRDITDFLKWVINNDDALEYLKENRDLKEAYEFTDGEETYLRKALSTANKKLDLVLGKVHRHKDNTIIRDEIDKASETIKELLKRISD